MSRATRHLVALSLAGLSALVGPELARADEPAGGSTSDAAGQPAGEAASTSVEPIDSGESEEPRRDPVTAAELEVHGGRTHPARPHGSRPAEEPVRWVSGRARYDAVIGWASRYQLATSTDPMGVEQQLWRRVDVLPFYHRLAVDGSLRLDEGVALSLHFSGWGTANLLADEGGGVAAGDVVLGYLQLDVAPRGLPTPVSLWVGRRFITHGPPGGVQLDGGGVRLSSRVGVFAELFVGRPVTPTRTNLLGPEPSFEGASVAYGARVGYDDPGVVAVSAAYAELWGHGMLGSRTIDVSGTWDPGPLSLEGSLKLDVTSPAVMLARVSIAAPIVRELSLDLEGQHLEPARWIPVWSILSAFEASTFDEVAAGATARLAPGLSARAQGAVRLYSGEVQGEIRVGYRADAIVRLVPVQSDGTTTFRVLASRRDDGVIGYTLVTAGLSMAPHPVVRVALDGALALDDTTERVSVSGRAALDTSPGAEWTVGAWASVGRTPTTDTDVRAMIRARWEPVIR